MQVTLKIFDQAGNLVMSLMTPGMAECYAKGIKYIEVLQGLGSYTCG